MQTASFHSLLLYVSCIAILVFYSYVLYLSKKPNVSEQYRNYYITKVDSCWEGKSNHYSIGDFLLLSDSGQTPCTITPSGWGKRENGGTWTIANKALIELPVSTHSDNITLSFLMTAFAPKSKQQIVNVFIDGQRITQWQVKHASYHHYDVIIPSAYNTKGKLSIELYIQNPLSPKSVDQGYDTRKLGIALKTLSIN